MSKQNLLESKSCVHSQSPKLLRNAIGLAVVAVTAFAACSSARAEPGQTNDKQVSFSRGTVIPVLLDSDLSSNISVRGDKFTTSVDNSKISYGKSMRGATITGVVNEVVPESDGRAGRLYLGFTSLRLADGRTFRLSGSLASMDAKQLHMNKEGLPQGKNTDKNGRLSFAGIGNDEGALVSRQQDGSLKVEDVMVGDSSAYVVGSVMSGSQQVHDIDLKAGTPMGMILDSRIQFSKHPEEAFMPYGRHGTYIHNGAKYYSYDGQPWVMNIASGDRYPVSGGAMDSNLKPGKNYNFQGHRYHMDSDTGERSQID
jgi:hypothetical protein